MKSGSILLQEVKKGVEEDWEEFGDALDALDELEVHEKNPEKAREMKEKGNRWVEPWPSMHIVLTCVIAWSASINNAWVNRSRSPPPVLQVLPGERLRWRHRVLHRRHQAVPL